MNHSDPAPPSDPDESAEPECLCQDQERCPVHWGHD